MAIPAIRSRIRITAEYWRSLEVSWAIKSVPPRSCRRSASRRFSARVAAFGGAIKQIYHLGAIGDEVGQRIFVEHGEVGAECFPCHGLQPAAWRKNAAAPVRSHAFHDRGHIVAKLAHDPADIDPLGRDRQPDAAGPAARSGDKACLFQAKRDLEQMVARNAVALGDVVYGAGARSTNGKVDQHPQRIVDVKGQAHGRSLAAVSCVGRRKNMASFRLRAIRSARSMKTAATSGLHSSRAVSRNSPSQMSKSPSTTSFSFRWAGTGRPWYAPFLRMTAHQKSVIFSRWGSQ